MTSLMLHLALPACAALLSACAVAPAASPAADSRFGDAARIAFAQQVARPAAVRNADPVAGMDGRAAQGVQQRYQKSFAEPAPQQGAFVIGVSGSK